MLQTETRQLDALAVLLQARQQRLATAESCTGGGIAYYLTNRAGSSLWFDRGFVTYSNASKRELLGVSEQTLQNCGAVSEEVVQQMAVGAVKMSDARKSLRGYVGDRYCWS